MADHRVASTAADLDISAALGSPSDPATPMRLRAIYRSTAVGDVIAAERSVIDSWPAELLAAVMAGAAFEPVARSRTRWRRVRSIADTVGPGMRLLLVGLNPSPMAADTGIGFARPGNRFWPAALEAGIVTADRDPEAALEDHGIGMTDLVKRTTARADELDRSEYVGGLERLERLAAWLQPGVVCFVGLSGWRAAVDRKATTGFQERAVGGRPAYVMPKPSGLNAHVTVHDLAADLGAAASGPTELRRSVS